MQVTRCRFFRTTGLALADLRTGLSATTARRVVGFSTLGCPGWEWSKILTFAPAHDFSAIELRGLQGNMDLPSRPEFQPDRIEQSKRDVSCTPSENCLRQQFAQLHDSNPEKHKQQIADAKRFIDLAVLLGSPNMRGFGNKIEGPKDQVMDALLAD
jgi:sugar phosphate isomerase/epimerase